MGNILKSLIGKYISKNNKLAFCHVDRVIVIEGNKAIVSAFIKMFNDILYHWYLEAEWATDKYGVHTITRTKLLREDELGGSNTEVE